MIHCYLAVFWKDVFGKIIRLEISEEPRHNDKNILNNTRVAQFSEEFYGDKEKAVVDTGFISCGSRIISLYKRNQTSYQTEVGREDNRDILRRRI